ncbi:MAG: hypothetical protein WCI38_07130 [Chthoniobacterales bacterium]
MDTRAEGSTELTEADMTGFQRCRSENLVGADVPGSSRKDLCRLHHAPKQRLVFAVYG